MRLNIRFNLNQSSFQTHSRLRMSVEPRKLLERIPFPASLTDGRNRYVAINSAHENLYGWNDQELVGKNPACLIAKSVKAAKIREIYSASGKEGWHGSLTNVDRRGREFPVVLHTRPVWLANRKLKLGVIHLIGQETALIRSLLDLAWLGGLEPDRNRQLPSLDKLTAREQEVFALLGQGLRTAEIADNMSVSFNTARVYIAAARRKLNCPNIETLRALAARSS